MRLPFTPRPAAHLILLSCLCVSTLWLDGCSSPPTQRAPLAGSPSAPGPSTAPADDATASTAQRFALWVEAFQDTARAAGISDATLHAAFDKVQYRPRLIQLDRSQPEFTRAIWDYVDAIVSPQRVANGQQKLAQYEREAQAAAATYGVPATVLMGVWGMESNYGRNFGDVPVIDALATLGFEGRRESWAKGELLAALKILQRGDIDREHMIGSWAGAMGHTQFMPTAFLSFAVDADGDGRRDIWGSVADVLASTANFLAKAGWRAEEPWGVEVQLPPDFDLMQVDPGTRQDSRLWIDAGVRSIDGTPMPAIADAYLLQPAGATGPTFLVGSNYRALLRYNNATSYALGVSLLAQRIGGGPGIQAPWPRELKALSRDEIQSLQGGLNRRGFDCGKPDGQFGPASRKALRLYQRSLGLPPDGFPTAELLRQLQDDQGSARP